MAQRHSHSPHPVQAHPRGRQACVHARDESQLGDQALNATWFSTDRGMPTDPRRSIETDLTADARGVRRSRIK